MRPWLLWALLPLILTLLLYGPACLDAAFISDDNPLIPGHLRPGDIAGEWTHSTHLHAADRDGGYLWRPLTSTVYQLWAGLFGRTPTPFRVLNLLWHLGALGALLGLARSLGARPASAAMVALAWAVHPLLPDAVCWIADLYDLMAATLLLCGLWLTVHPRPKLALRAGGVAGLFFLALLSKEASLSFLAIAPVVGLLLRGRRAAVAIALACGAVAAVHSAWHGAVVGSFENSALDLLVVGDFVGLWTQFIGWPVFMPVRAGFTHLVEPGAEAISPLGVGIMVLSVAALVTGLVRKERALTLLGLGLGTWVVMLTPVSLAAMAFGQQSSRYLYMPLALSMGLLAGIRLPAGLPISPLLRLAPALVVVGWVGAWLPATWTRIAAWENEFLLFADELVHEPDNPFAQKGMGRMLVGAGAAEQGLALWFDALSHPPASSFVMDVQQERLDFAVAAERHGQPSQGLQVLDAFIAEEGLAGRPVHDSVHQLRARMAPTE